MTPAKHATFKIVSNDPKAFTEFAVLLKYRLRGRARFLPDDVPNAYGCRQESQNVLPHAASVASNSREVL